MNKLARLSAAGRTQIRGWTLVTRNTADIARTGVSLLDPFDPRRAV